MNDTIAAISTAMGVGAISIIRVSGKDSIKIVNEIFTGKDLNEVPTHTIHYGHIVDEKIPIDEVLIIYTRMDQHNQFTVDVEQLLPLYRLNQEVEVGGQTIHSIQLEPSPAELFNKGTINKSR